MVQLEDYCRDISCLVRESLDDNDNNKLLQIECNHCNAPSIFKWFKQNKLLKENI
ncbi:MAG: hypothetical protein ACOCP8_03010 [archaeon]